MKNNEILIGVASIAIIMSSPPASARPAQVESATADRPAPSTKAERAAARRAQRAAQRAERRRLKAIRAAERAGAETAKYRDESGEIIVVGVRGSIASARDRKKNAKQLVDVVSAEDAGKLPDNNVPEAIARATGVNIERSGGRGGNITIRGLAGIQTTVNGKEVAGAPTNFVDSNSTGSGAGRSMNLSDIPAELLKSVEVYKTRTADQVEGGIAGTINVELRRPLDLPKGWTVAGGARGAYNDVNKLVSPYASLLAGYRFDTGAGEMGFLVNGAYSKGQWNDIVIDSESPRPFWGYTYDTLDPAIRDTLTAPYKVKNMRNYGYNEQRSLNLSYQWRPQDNLEFILEGSYFGNRGGGNGQSYELRLKDWPFDISNLKYNDKGGLVGITLTNANRELVDEIPLYVFGSGGINENETFTGNLETHWHDDLAYLDFAATYTRNDYDNYGIGYSLFYPGVTQVDLQFDSGAVPGGGPFFSAPNLNPADPNSARIREFTDGSNTGNWKNWAFQGDLRFDLGSGFVRNFKTGLRFTTGSNYWTYGYRGVSYRGRVSAEDRSLPLNSVPGVPVVIQTPRIAGGSKFSFASLDSNALYRNRDQMRQFILSTPQRGFWLGGGKAKTIEAAWTPAVPGGERGSEGNAKENTLSAYVLADFAFKLGFRFDGNVGVRYVNTYGSVFGVDIGVRQSFDAQGKPVLDGNGNPVFVEYDNNFRGRGNNYVLLPSAYLTAHFTDNLRLRLAYSYNEQRPSFWDLRASLAIDPFAVPPRGDGGNPQLKPFTTEDYNASLEWYFGSLGSLTINGFVKKQDGFIFYLPGQEVPAGYSTPFTVYRPRNGGQGRTAGVEAALTTTFAFIDPSLKSLGVTVNGTFLPTSWLETPIYLPPTPPNQYSTEYRLARVVAPFASKYTYNLIGFFDNGWLSGRVAYNWRSEYRNGFDVVNPGYVQVFRPISRLDAALNYTPVRWLTLTLEGSNLTGASDRRYYDVYDIPVGLLQQGRTIQAGVRFRF